MLRLRHVILALGALGLAASACAGDDAATPATTAPGTSAPATSTSGAASTTSEAPTSTAGAGSTTTATRPFEGTLDPTTVAPGSGTALLTAVRSGVQPGYDRVVFEFDGSGLPGVSVAYAPRPIRADASGEEVTIEGAAVLLVRMSPAAGVDLSSGTPIITYTGPPRLRPQQANVIEIVRTGDFEGVLTWAIGLRARTPYRVLTLQQPSRVVIDITTP